MRRPVPARSDNALAAGLVAAFLIAVPAAAQTVAPPSSVAPAPVAGSDPAASTTTITTPALESPALGPLAGRDTPLLPRPYAGGTLPGFATSGYGIGGYGISGLATPFELGNRPYAFRPSLGVELLATNNLFQTSQDQRGDFVAMISPTIEAAVSTARLSGALRYSPTLRLYANYPNNNGFDQFGDAMLLAAVVPGVFYVDLRGSASVLPATLGQIPGSGQFAVGNETMQTYTAQVTPFLTYRFGSTATAQVGYSLQYSEQGWADFNNTGTAGSPANFLAHRGFAVVRSGEDFGRLALQARVDGIRYVGDGIYDGAHRFISALEVRYAITHSIALLGEIGYQSESFSGTNPINIEDAIWSVGLRLKPNPDSLVIVRFGHRDGYNSFSLNAGVAVGVRTDLFATYRDSIGTSLTEAQDLLATTTTDSLGNPVDSQTGAPVVLINSFLGISNTLYRLRLGTASIRHHWARDAFTLSGTWQEQIPLTSANNAFNVGTNSGVYAGFSWAHEFSPRTTGVATAQYGWVAYTQPGQGSNNIAALSGTLVHWLSETLAAALQASWSNNNYSQPGQGYSQFVVRVGLRKSF